jgi:DNA polymerase-3 subunit epsilon
MEFIAFDLETTGFFAGSDQIVEIGAIKYRDGQPESMFVTLVNPGRPIPIEAQRVNGISDEMVVNAPTIDQLMDAFTDFCGETPMIAHNAPFDYQFLVHEIKRLEIPAPRGHILDSLPMSRKVFPGLMNYKLGTLVEHLKIPGGGFHRAQADCLFLGQLFCHILDRITVSNQPPTIETLIQLCNNQSLRFPIIDKQPKQLDLLGV